MQLLFLLLLLVCVLPANIYSALNRVEFGGHGAGPAYLLVRVPFQLFVVCWTYFATEQGWWRGRRAEAWQAVVGSWSNADGESVRAEARMDEA